VKQLEGQSWWSVCGASFSSPTHSRVFLLDGAKVRLTYPAMIDYHDVVPRSRGGDPLDIDNQVPLCHSCHDAHHFSPGKRLSFDGDHWLRADGASGLLRMERVR
jgi:hypothetical protein